MIPESFIQELLGRVDIVDVIDGLAGVHAAGASVAELVLVGEVRLNDVKEHGDHGEHAVEVPGPRCALEHAAEPDLEPGPGALVDPFAGRADLEARVLRHVSPAFAEDPVRLLRAFRVAAALDFGIYGAPETFLVDKDGRLRASFSDASLDSMAAVTRLLVGE